MNTRGKDFFVHPERTPPLGSSNIIHQTLVSSPGSMSTGVKFDRTNTPISGVKTPPNITGTGLADFVKNVSEQIKTK
jgi:hypothetical protein